MCISKFSITAPLLSVLLVAGCGGGSSTVSPVVAVSAFSALGSGAPTRAELLQLSNTFTVLGDAVSSGAITLARPNAASATYDGVVTATFASGTVVAGRMEMIADFSADTVSGTTGDYQIFVAESLGGGTVTPTGSIPITNGTTSGSTFTADLNGTLTTGLGPYALSSRISGVFAENGPQSVALGTMVGDVVLPDNSTEPLQSGAIVGVAR